MWPIGAATPMLVMSIALVHPCRESTYVSSTLLAKVAMHLLVVALA